MNTPLSEEQARERTIAWRDYDVARSVLDMDAEIARLREEVARLKGDRCDACDEHGLIYVTAWDHANGCESEEAAMCPACGGTKSGYASEVTKERDAALAERDALADERDALRAERNTPHIEDFIEAVRLEALHQRGRWSADHDAGKADADWFWLIGWLAGKAVHATSDAKKLHHIITTAAACLNWHAAKTGADTRMRPGIEPPKEKTDATYRAGLQVEGDQGKETPSE